MEEITILDTQIKPSFGFTCKICSGCQETDYMGWQNKYFPVCNECIKDLGEFVKEKRANQAQ